MRDLVFILIFPILIYYAIKRPFIGVGLWFWSSNFKINELLYGFAHSIPINMVFALCTIISFITYKDKPKFKLDSLFTLVLLFFLWTTLSSMLTISTESIVWERWNYLLKTLIFFLFAVLVLKSQKELDFVFTLLILGVGFLGMMEGMKFIVSAGGHRINSISGVSGDNNFFALMINISIPILIYLISIQPKKIIRYALKFVGLFLILGIIATYSRGGFLGLAIIAFYTTMGSKYKIRVTLLLGLVVLAGMFLMPDEWFSRMNTLENAEEDSSFMGRVVAWKISTLLAMHNITGGGFNALINFSLWEYYSMYIHELSFIETPEPDPLRPHAAHSIYFQVLGDHGFIGLILFISMLSSAYFKITKAYITAKKLQLSDGLISLCQNIRLSLIVYCIAGAAFVMSFHP